MLIREIPRTAIDEVIRMAKERRPIDPQAIKDSLVAALRDTGYPEAAGQVVGHVMSKRDGRAVGFIPALCKCGRPDCAGICPSGALTEPTSGSGPLKFDPGMCIGCGQCGRECDMGAFVERSEVPLVLQMLQQTPRVFAILAPAFAPQFGPRVTPGRLKCALLRLGVHEVLEVAVGADVTTIREADEFVARVKAGQRFVITSSCCPAFIKLVEKRRPAIAHLVTPTVSPMVALGRLLKADHPGCKVVFIGPCVAKKVEAARPEFSTDIDAVLTFKELNAIFNGFGIDPKEEMEVELPGAASHDGRTYAHTGGVSEAIQAMVSMLSPGMRIEGLKGDGIRQCSEILAWVEDATVQGNFLEGMACPGGCVGGPGTLVDVPTATAGVDKYADSAVSRDASADELAADLAQRLGHLVDLTSPKQG